MPQYITAPLVFLGCITLGSLLALALLVFVGKTRRKKEPRTIVSLGPIPLGSPALGAPSGIHVIDGVRVREGDIVILTHQSQPATNGVWLVRKSTWQRYNQLDPNDIGHWWVTTAGTQAETLWVCGLNAHWRKIDKGRRLMPFDSEDFAPNDPAEAAAYLLRLGVIPSQIQWTRNTCIQTLVVDGFLTRAQGNLLLLKPENLTTEVSDGTGLLVRLTEQSWTGQVVAHMASIRGTHLRLMRVEGYGDRVEEEEVLGSAPVFVSRELAGFKRIPKNPPEPPKPPPPRRSRYERDPVI